MVRSNYESLFARGFRDKVIGGEKNRGITFTRERRSCGKMVSRYS